MKVLWGVISAVAMAWGGAVGIAQPSDPVIGTIELRQINVVEIDTSHVKAAVNLALVPAQSATLADLRLCSLRLNGLPVFAEPLNQEIVLQKGMTTSLPPLYVTILFRDLYTVMPLRQMIERQSVHLEGELVASVRLNLLEKMVLGAMHPKVDMPLDQDVPAKIGGSELQRTLVLAVLSGIEAGLGAKAKVEKYIPGRQLAWITALQAQAQSNLISVVTSFKAKQDGASYPVQLNGLGFRIGEGKVVTTAEALAPWKYDADFLTAVNLGTQKVQKKSLEIELAPLNQGSNPLKLSAKDFVVEQRGTPVKEKVTSVDGNHAQIEVLRRDSPGSLALLLLHAPDPDRGLMPAPAAVAAKLDWGQVAVFRLRTDPATKKVQVDVLQLGARRDGAGIQLSEPVDSAVFGSPIVTPEGVIGMVQGEKTGTFLPQEMYTPGPQLK